METNKKKFASHALKALGRVPCVKNVIIRNFFVEKPRVFENKERPFDILSLTVATDWGRSELVGFFRFELGKNLENV